MTKGGMEISFKADSNLSLFGNRGPNYSTQYGVAMGFMTRQRALSR
jgi:hypothetical protein